MGFNLKRLVFIVALGVTLSSCITRVPPSPELAKAVAEEALTASTVPSASTARRFLAELIARDGKGLAGGSIYLAGRNPITDAKISGPNSYSSSYTGRAGDHYCMNFKLEGATLFGSDVKLYALVRKDGAELSASLRLDPLVGATCKMDFAHFPELEAFNNIRAKRSPPLFSLR